MKLRKNYTLTFTLNVTWLCLFIPPIFVIVSLFVNTERLINEELIPIFIALMILILMIITFMSIIHLIICIFTKRKIVISEKKVECDDESASFGVVRKVHLRYGQLGKYSYTPCSLELYYGEKYPIMEIKNPSFISCLIIMSKCKGAKRILIPKWLVILLAALYFISAIIFIAVNYI